MTISTGVLILCLTFELIFSEEVKCRNSVICSCGSKGKNVTICAESASATEVCSRLSQCETCNDGYCAKCPKGFEGRFCSRETNQKISRQKHLFDKITATHGRRLSRQVERNIYEEASEEKKPACHCQNGGICYSGQICVCPPGWTGESCEISTGETDTTCKCQNGGICQGDRRWKHLRMCVCPPEWTGPFCEESSEGTNQTCKCQNGGVCKGRRRSNLPRMCVCPAEWKGLYCEERVPVNETCGDPGFLTNGFRRNLDGSESHFRPRFKKGDTVVYRCALEDYTLQGSSHLNCKNDGTWSSAVPKCIKRTEIPEKKTCSDPGFIPNGIRLNMDLTDSSTPSNFEAGESVVYGCDSEDYALRGSSLLTCQKDGTWSSPLPKCFNPTGDVQMCPDPGQVMNAERLNTDGSPSVEDQQYRVGQSVVYTCRPGFALQRRSLITCLASGAWSFRPPYCTPTTPSTPETESRTATFCRDPGTDANGSRKPSRPPNRRGFPPGSRVVYSCNPGYNLEGEESIFCLTSGLWSASRPECEVDYEEPGTLTELINKVTQCVNPGPIYHGQVVYYPIIDDRSRPTPDPNEPDEPEYPEGSLLLYSCKPGYTLVGRPTLTCKSTGSWSSESPVCVKDSSNSNQSRTCPDPGDIVNGQIFIFPPFSRRREYPERSRIRYSCSTGYELVGASTLRCQSSGRWSTEPPMCIPDSVDSRKVTTCIDPGEIPNGQVLITAPFTRRQNYPVTSRLRYFCTNGYILVGSSILTCESTGYWSTDPPKCISDSSDSKETQSGTKCTDPGDIPNGRIIVVPPFTRRREYAVRSQLRYSCAKEYILVGASTLRCESTGSWSTEPPMCISANPDERLTCENPGPIDNGRVFYHPPVGTRRIGPKPSLDYDNQDEYSEGSRLQYVCDEGYQIQGPDVLTCQSNGFWSAKAPECVTDCGRSFLQATRKVGNGEQTMSGDWPWVVSISVEQNGRSRFICGGAVVNSRTILTAAHCLVLADKFILRFGKHHFNMEDDDAEVLIGRSTRVIIHPDYNNVTHDSDIGLVLFEPRIRFSIRVQPICLPTPESTFKNVVPGVVGYVAGWGETEKGLPSDELLLASLPVLSEEACIEAFKRRNINPTITRNMFCAGYPDGRQSVCEGDSGSPYVFYDKKTDRYRLEGVVSFGVRRQCGLPAIFTKVFQFLPWIYRNRQ